MWVIIFWFQNYFFQIICRKLKIVFGNKSRPKSQGNKQYFYQEIDWTQNMSLFEFFSRDWVIINKSWFWQHWKNRCHAHAITLKQIVISQAALQMESLILMQSIFQNWRCNLALLWVYWELKNIVRMEKVTWMRIFRVNFRFS